MLQKRLFDLFCVIPGLVLLLPIFLLIFICIKLDSNGPIFFKQRRVGQFGKVFDVLKFRTMVDDAERQGGKITVGKDPRITRIGAILRKFKIDELPQLINVLRGEMSLVGPRPEVPEYVECYPENIKEIVLSVPPGITDYASIEFKDENEILSRSENPQKEYVEQIVPIKLSYYCKYVKERSLLLDIRLIFRTIWAIIA